VANELDDILAEAVRRGASDVHVTVGVPVQLRIEGDWCSYDDERLTPPDCEDIAAGILGDGRLAELARAKDLDLSYSVPSVGRFRVNIFYQRGSVGVAIRVLPFRIPEFRELGLPVETMRQLCVAPNGLVLVCGPTGSGKSTTLAAMVDYINRTEKRHIVTIEDPIEFLHDHKRSLVDQREVGTDTCSFLDAMKHVLRQSPDVVLVGEIRDPDTVRTSLMLAETGHLVLSTIHTGEVTQGLSRLCDMFSAEQQQEIRVSLSLVLRGMIVQQLLPTAIDDRRRVLAEEVMLPNAAVRHLIREGKFQQVYSELQTRQDAGMRTMNMSLLQLWRAGKIARQTALDKSQNPLELGSLMEHTGYGSV